MPIELKIGIINKKGFMLVHSRGSHNYFSGNINNVPRMVTVPFHGSGVILPRTMKSIIAQSGIGQSEWFAR